jgi:hypothetical protein
MKSVRPATISEWAAPIGVVAAVVGSAWDTWAVGKVSAAVLARLGVGVLLCSLTGVIRRGMKSPQSLREADYSLGYDHGCRDGRRVARPVVLPFPREGERRVASR